MLTSNPVVQERRTRSLNMIRKIVQSRTQMLSLYSQLAKRKPFAEDPDVPDLIEEFTESLVDYTANAHFQLYRYFAEKRERRSDILEVVEKIYPRIMDITQTILEFNDKYDSVESRRRPNELEVDLCRLGEELAERIELEDDLIDAWSGGGRRRA